MKREGGGRDPQPFGDLAGRQSRGADADQQPEHVEPVFLCECRESGDGICLFHTSRVSRVELAMPPIMGTAMRCMTSEPVPSFHRIGSRPAMMAVTVIIFGRTRSTAPSMIAA